MNAPKDPDVRARLWVALGNQPGVSAWFTVWLLSRAARQHDGAPHKVTQPATGDCKNQARGSSA